MNLPRFVPGSEPGPDFLALLKTDKDVCKHLSESELADKFDLKFHFAHVDTIFRRVFGRA